MDRQPVTVPAHGRLQCTGRGSGQHIYVPETGRGNVFKGNIQKVPSVDCGKAGRRFCLHRGPGKNNGIGDGWFEGLAQKMLNGMGSVADLLAVDCVIQTG